MAQMRRRRGLVVLYWILLIFSRCGLAVHVPMEGVSRICRQGDQQKKMPHAHGLLRLRGGTAVSSGVIPSDRSIREALSAAGPVAKSIPPALLRAVRDGRVGLEVIGRFAEWHQRLPRCLRWLLQIEMFRQRILADDNFIFKVVIEATLACVVQAVAEIQHRGEDFGKELDFVLGGIVAVLYSSAVSTLLAAPVAVPHQAQKSESRFDAFLRSCPSSVFQEGPPPYSTLQRVSTLLFHMPRLFVTGFSASFVAYVYITGVLLVRHAISKLLMGGKWRRKPKTLKELTETLAASSASTEGTATHDGHASDGKGLQSEDRLDLLEEVGLGSLSDVGLAAIGIDPSSLPPSTEATSWLNEAPAPAWEGGGRSGRDLPLSDAKTASDARAHTPSACYKALAALAQLQGDPTLPPAGGSPLATGDCSREPRTQARQQEQAVAVDRAWGTMDKVQIVRPLRVRSRSFNDVSHLLQADADGAASGDVKTPGDARLQHADTCTALLPDAGGRSAAATSTKEVHNRSERENLPAASAPPLDLQARVASLEAKTTTLPAVLQDGGEAEETPAGTQDGASVARRRLSSPPIASPVQSLTRSSTMLADAISAGRQPILRGLPGAPKVLFRGGKYGLALSLMIEGPTMLRPSPSLVFLPPQAGKGEGIGLIPWAEVVNVSLVCGLYVAFFSNIRGHIVAGIEMRILDKVLSGENQAWRRVGSVLLRTLNLYIGSITLLMGLELFSSLQDEEPQTLGGDWHDFDSRPIQNRGMGSADVEGWNGSMAGLKSGASCREDTKPAEMSGGGAYRWSVTEEHAPSIGQEQRSRTMGRREQRN